MANNNKTEIRQNDLDIILSILDTYHDFCKAERASSAARAAKKAKKAETEEEKKEEKKEVEGEDKADESRLTFTRSYLPALLYNTYSNFAQKESYHDNVATLTGNKVNSVSHLEYQTVDYFEDTFESDVEPHLYTKETLYFEDIIDGYKAIKDGAKVKFDEETNPLWKKYKECIDVRILELVPGKAKLGKNTNNANIIANFILNFFYQTAKQPRSISFDAGQRVLGQLFMDMDQVSNLVIPQNIADSAITFFGKLGGQNIYTFPSKTDTIPFKSNSLSSKYYNLEFKNNEFSDKNPYGFSLEIKETDDENVYISVPFSASPPQTEGPSVNYIIDILDRSKKDNPPDFKTIKRKSNMLAIGDAMDNNTDFKNDFVQLAKSHKNGLLFDIKRAGDHEQVMGVKEYNELIKNKADKEKKLAILSTIDILCALKARREKMNCVLQLKDRIVLFRNPVALPAAQQIQVAILQIRESINLLSKLQSFPKDLNVKLKAQLANFAKAKQAKLGKDIKGEDNTTDQKCKIMMEQLLNIKMLESEEYVQSLINSNFNINPQGLQDIENKLNEYKDNNNQIKDNKQIIAYINGLTLAEEDDELDNINATLIATKNKYKKTFENINDQLNLQVKGDAIWKISGEKDFELVKDIVGADNIFTGESLPTYYFYYEPYKQLYDIMTFAYNLKASATGKKARDFYVRMKGILSEKGKRLDGMDYMATINTILDQFQKDSPHRKELKASLDFYQTAKEKAIKENLSLPDVMIDMFIGDNGITNLINVYYDKLFGAGQQQQQQQQPQEQQPQGLAMHDGGNDDVKDKDEQSRSCEFLFRKITAAAANYMESVYTEVYEKFSKKNFASEFLEFLEKVFGKKNNYNIDELLNTNIQISENDMKLAEKIYFSLQDNKNLILVANYIENKNKEAHAILLSTLSNRVIAEKKLSSQLKNFRTTLRREGILQRIQKDDRLFKTKLDTFLTKTGVDITSIKNKKTTKQLFSYFRKGITIGTKKGGARTKAMARKAFFGIPTSRSTRKILVKGKLENIAEILPNLKPKFKMPEQTFNKIDIDINPFQYFKLKKNESIKEYFNDIADAIPNNFRNKDNTFNEEYHMNEFIICLSILTYFYQLYSHKPSYFEFLQYFTSEQQNLYADIDEGDNIDDNNLKQYYATALLDEIQMVWETGLHEIKYSSDFIYEAKEMEGIVSYLLTKRQFGNQKIASFNISSETETYILDDMDKFLSLANKNGIDLIYKEHYILFLLTLMENAMNPLKKSYFLYEVPNIPKEDHNIVWGDFLPSLLSHYMKNLPRYASQISNQNNQGGGSYIKNKRGKTRRAVHLTGEMKSYSRKA